MTTLLQASVHKLLAAWGARCHIMSLLPWLYSATQP